MFGSVLKEVNMNKFTSIRNNVMLAWKHQNQLIKLDLFLDFLNLILVIGQFLLHPMLILSFYGFPGLLVSNTKKLTILHFIIIYKWTI